MQGLIEPAGIDSTMHERGARKRAAAESLNGADSAARRCENPCCDDQERLAGRRCRGEAGRPVSRGKSRGDPGVSADQGQPAASSERRFRHILTTSRACQTYASKYNNSKPLGGEKDGSGAQDLEEYGDVYFAHARRSSSFFGC